MLDETGVERAVTDDDAAKASKHMSQLSDAFFAEPEVPRGIPFTRRPRLRGIH